MTQGGVVTFFFVDQVGSTAQLQRLGDEGAEPVRAAMFAIIRTVLADYRGVEVDNTGDGVMASFMSAVDAVDAAAAMLQGAERHNRTAEEFQQIRLKVGVHSGDAVINDEGRHFGMPVVIAARLCAAAATDEALVSDTVRSLVSSRGRHEFADRRALDLKGVGEPVVAHPLRWTPTDTAISPRERVQAETLPRRLVRPRGSVFVGRSTERARLDGARTAALAGDRQVVLIAGEPGVGKTTLVAELCITAHEAGTLVLYGRCDEGLGVPYQPFIEALDGVLGDHEALIRSRVDPARFARLTRLLPALAKSHHSPGPPAAEPETERHLWFTGITAALAAVAGEVPVILVLDDLHWADPATLLLLRHVATNVDGRVLLLGTYRDSDVTASDTLLDLVAALRREPGIECLSLTGISGAGLTELLALVAGHDLGDEGRTLAHTLRDETSGNPFFIGEVLRHLVETGALTKAEDGRWTVAIAMTEVGLPASVRDVIERRVAALGDHALQVLTLAAVIGRDFELDLLATVADEDEESLIDVLDVAEAATLVLSTGPDRFTFVHALVPHTLTESLSLSRRGRAHRRVAEAIEAGPQPAQRAAEIALHWLEAGPAHADLSVLWAERAGDAALAALAPADAVAWFDRVLDLLEDDGDTSARCRALVGLGDAQSQIGDPAYRATLLEAARRAIEIGEDHLLVRAVLANNRGFASAMGEVDTDRISLIEAALAVVGVEDSTDRARLLATLTAELAFADDFERIRVLGAAAVDMARRLGDQRLLLDAERLRTDALNVPDTLAERRAQTDELIEIARRIDDPIALFDVLRQNYVANLQAGEREGTDRALAAMRDLKPRLDAQRDWVLSWVTASSHFVRGDLSDADSKIDRILERGLELGQPDAVAVYGGELANLRWIQGRSDELRPLLAKAVDDNPGIPAFRAALAHSHLDAGDRAGALELLHETASHDFADLPYDLLWLTAMTMWSETACELGETDIAPRLYSRVAPWVDQVAATATNIRGPVAHCVALLADVLGRADECDEHFTAAIAASNRLDAKFFLARSRLGWGEVLTSRPGGGDRQHGITLVRSALAAARHEGYGHIERRAAAVLAGQ